ncbi:MAG: homoserine O-acetyltransferase [Rickettsiales bacterium]|nr:homoserine O-acetyltransferase [Rickettsiales bacterium]
MVSNKKNIYSFSHTPKIKLNTKFKLENGKNIINPEIAYRTYGKLNKNKSNGILVCHALTGDQYAAGINPITGKKGWWSNIIGKGKVLDTNKYFIICSNVLGGCMGTTGPKSLNPKSKKPYELKFPEISIGDMVKLQVKLIDFLKIDKLFCVIGGSMGGMQVLEWGANYSKRARLLIPIATSFRHTAQNIALHEAGRQAIRADPYWNNGKYIEKSKLPKKGLSTARMIAHITYMSEESLSFKFGRNKKDNTLSKLLEGGFEVEKYLQYQGTNFVKRFDPNSYIYLTRTMDRYDLSEKFNGKLELAFKNNPSKWLLISFTSDWLFPTSESKLLVNALASNACNVSFVEIDSDRGHDSFLLKIPRLYSILSGFLAGARSSK